MSENSPSDQTLVIEDVSEGYDLQSKLKLRYYRAINYLVLYLYIIIVYGGAILSDYILFILITRLLKDDIAKYPIVSSVFDYAKIGLSLLFIAAAVIHGIISTISQIKLDIKFSKESEDN